MNFFRILLFLTYAFLHLTASGQSPSYFTYDNEAGIPSDEVYSIVQDQKGMIWIGCESGMFKFDGFRFIEYSPTQAKSKSITNLVVSPNGRVYGINFNNQIFYTEGSQLKELKHDFANVKSIVVDKKNDLYATHDDGLAIYNFQQSKWSNLQIEQEKDQLTTLVKIDERGQVIFLTRNGICYLKNGKLTNKRIDRFHNTHTFLLATNNKSEWIFSILQNINFQLDGDSIYENKSEKLSKLLENRKITKVVFTNDNTLWVGTYKGIIQYNISKDRATLFYPSMAISDVIIDREGNYWFTTLQSGIIRVPNLNFITWNAQNPSVQNEKITHLTQSRENVYFSTINGRIGKLHKQTEKITMHYTGQDANVESITYDEYHKELLVFVKYQLLTFNDHEFNKLTSAYSAIKDIVNTKDWYFIATRHGLYYMNSNDQKGKLNEWWARDLSYDSNNRELWVACNEGVLKYKLTKDKVVILDTLLQKKQTLSICYDLKSKNHYALTSNGTIHEISNGNIKTLVTVPKEFKSISFAFKDDRFYVLSNQGVWVYNDKNKEAHLINRERGLSSNNVQDIIFSNGFIWLATGKGLQRIPENLNQNIAKAKVHIKRNVAAPIKLEYGEALSLYPETSLYSSNGEFTYTYRVNKKEWINLPGNIREIQIPGLPYGDLRIELKVIDHLERDSENTICLEGYVSPPLWLKWWFLLLMLSVVVVLLYLFVRKRIKTIKKREYQKSLLLKSQLKAIRAQMNPHFMYNTLNSIQDLILQNDIKNTNYYLTKFSQLMRQILTFSEEESITLNQEIEMLNNYLSLEKLRFGNDFTYVISVERQIDIEHTVFPSLIIQPFIENAMKHGLLHRKGQKTLKIEFLKQSNNQLKVIIIDNGVGRKRSQEIQKKQLMNHKSFASNAVKRRIELLNQGKKFSIQMNISDAFDNQKDTGTIIEINIKYLTDYINTPLL